MDPLIPPAKRGGNRRTVNVREIVDGLMHVLSTAASGGRFPRTCGRHSTDHDYFDLWSWDGTLAHPRRAFHRCREAAAREASATAAAAKYGLAKSDKSIQVVVSTLPISRKVR